MKPSAQLALGDFLGASKELKQRIQALASELLLSAREHGVGFDEVRHAAETRGLLTGHEAARFLSFGSQLMRSAGGVPVRYRRSRHAAAQRRRVAVYVHQSFLPSDENARATS
jgi:hypothetical protein